MGGTRADLPEEKKAKEEMKCLFCKTDGTFNTREHIVPESLGNDTDILYGIICEKCQNYFGTAIEKPALEQTPVAFWRSYLGIRTKKNQLPSVDLNPPNKGAIPSLHPLTDIGVGFTTHDDGSTSVDIDNSNLIERLLSREASKYHLVLTPWHLSILGRFIGKIGLEYLASVELDYALSTEFDSLRSFVRRGSMKQLWPIYWGQQGELGDLKGKIIWNGQVGRQEIVCYRFVLSKTIKEETVFVFSMGTDLMLMCLSHRIPVPDFENSVVGAKLPCIYYEDGTW